ncbi:MAG: hypothetical protein CBB97_24710 [Candidatus Endolissoclinum sp. TMED37]|nr:MAG: hypothetical protein CBB97_24710 [Candidatus Endolissoclinum sp. TMED37]
MKKNIFLIFLLVSLIIYLFVKKNIEGFENPYKRNNSLTSIYNYYKNLYDLKKRKLMSIYEKNNITNMINKKIKYYNKTYF